MGNCVMLTATVHKEDTKHYNTEHAHEDTEERYCNTAQLYQRV